LPSRSRLRRRGFGLLALWIWAAYALTWQGKLYTDRLAAMFANMAQAHIDFTLSSLMDPFFEAGDAIVVVAWHAAEECLSTTRAAFDLTGGRATY
jgi:hypothetical protein